MKDDFIPRRDGDLNSFEENFRDKLAIHAATLELTAAEATSTKNIIDSHRNAFSRMNSKKSESKAATEENTNRKEEAVAEMRRMAKKIKASKNYTTAIGDDLGIIGTMLELRNVSELKPELKAKKNGSEVIVQFRKNGTDGVKIYSRRGTETEFTFLALDTSTPYNDSREKLDPGKPEQREYYAIYFEEDKDVGEKSDTVMVTLP